MSDQDNYSIKKAEINISRILEPELSQHGMLTMTMFNTICEAMSQIQTKSVTSVPQALKVAISLLMRISNDLRTTSLLAFWGYPTQAASLVSSIYETSLTIVYIGNNETIAQEWIDHSDKTKSFRSAFELTKKALSSLNLDDTKIKNSNLYRTYQQLCMAKHSNPLYQTQLGFKMNQGIVQAMNGPDSSENSIRVAWFAMEHGTRFCLTACSLFIEYFLSEEQRNKIRIALDNISSICNELSKNAIERFGSPTPYPSEQV